MKRGRFFYAVFYECSLSGDQLLILLNDGFDDRVRVQLFIGAWLFECANRNDLSALFDRFLFYAAFLRVLCGYASFHFFAEVDQWFVVYDHGRFFDFVRFFKNFRARSFIVDVGHFDLCLHDVGHSFSERGGFHV